MSAVINLTLPFYPEMPVGNVWAHDAPFRTRQIATYAAQGARIDSISMQSESGTRLMTQTCYDPAFPRVGERDLGDLVDLPAVVIDIPKAAGQEIAARDIEEKVASDPAFAVRDAVLIRTGWGDNERYRELGDDYAIRSPHFALEGSLRLAEVMREKRSNTLAIDVAYIGNCAPDYMVPEWVSLPPWLRPQFPSEQAKIYIRHYKPFKSRKDWAASRPLHAIGNVLAALCNTGAIRTKRVLLTALPLYVRDAPGTPIYVVAKEIA